MAHSEVSSAIRGVSAYKLYATCTLLQDFNSTMVPLRVLDKMYQCGMPEACKFYFCKPIAPYSIVVSIITAKKRVIQPLELAPNDKFSKITTWLNSIWPAIQPHEMKLKLRDNGKRFDILHSNQTLTQLGISNMSWLKLDISHPDLIPINVYQIDNKVTKLIVPSTMTLTQFKEKVYNTTSVTPGQGTYLVGLSKVDDSDVPTINSVYSKENHVFSENICFLYESSKARDSCSVRGIGAVSAKSIMFSFEASGNILHKYLVASGVCPYRNKIQVSGGSILQLDKTLQENGITKIKNMLRVCL
jgi:hypothetical protein